MTPTRVPPRIPVIRTGTANLASVLAALRRAGAEPVLTNAPEEVAEAQGVVLPGVGSFAAGMQGLRGTEGLCEALRERVERGAPTLTICLGLALLGESSDEDPGVEGIGALAFGSHRIREDSAGANGRLRVPHLGWNRVAPDEGCELLAPGHAYFAHSYRVESVPEGWRAGRTEYGGSFVSALERDGVLACQFHPRTVGCLRSGPHSRLARAERRMLTARVIPCLDVKDGRIVKGVRFQGLRDAGDPVERSALYEEQGADEIVLLDVSATPEGRGHARETVRAVRERLGIPLTVGGGVRVAEDAGALLESGADKVGVNTAAVERPELLTEIAERFGSQCAILALDAAARGEGGGWEVVVRSGRDRTGLDAIDWARRAAEAGAGEILLTSWDRDGTRSGYDCALLAAVSEAVSVPVIASGGAARSEDLAEALKAGASAVLAASLFHDGDYTVGDVKRELAALGVEVRL